MKMELRKDMNCKIILDNNYVYHGVIKDFNDYNIILLDRYGNSVIIDKKRVSVFEELKC